MARTAQRLDKNHQAIQDLLAAHNVTVRSKFVKAPGVGNAKESDTPINYIVGLFFNDLESATPVCASSTFEPRSPSDFRVDPTAIPMPFWEHDCKDLAIYARVATGFTVVTLEETLPANAGEHGEQGGVAETVRHWGRSICSGNDVFNSYTGFMRALRMALDAAAVTATPLGLAWLDMLAKRNPTRAKRIQELKSVVTGATA